MAKINLLPSEISKAKRKASPEFNLRALFQWLLVINGILLLGALGLRVFSLNRSKGLKAIYTEYQQADIINKKIAAIKQEEEKLTQEFNALSERAKRDMLWSEKLSRLSAIVPDEVWFTQFSFKGKSLKDATHAVLYLKGGLRPSTNSSAIVTLSKFINQLKEDPAFSADFENPVLTDSKTEKQEDIEIMTFAIEVPFKKKASLVRKGI